MSIDRIEWPEGKQFAFTIVDDTDQSTVANAKPVYDLLAELGFRTTKTVWPLDPVTRQITGGSSLADPEYARWVLELQRNGFEIALHGAADESSVRARVLEGFARFEEVLGYPPEMHVNHVGQREAMYWGADRLDPPVRWVYEAYRRLRSGQGERYLGHVPGTDHFWGDECRARVRFVRNLVWPQINTLAADPLMPYHDPSRPFVRYWYSSSYGSGLRAFLHLLRPENQDRLCAEGGACIVYTHLGSGFHPIGEAFRATMRHLASLPGWFVPASTLLSHVGVQRGWKSTAHHGAAYRTMQARWLYHQVRRNVG